MICLKMGGGLGSITIHDNCSYLVELVECVIEMVLVVYLEHNKTIVTAVSIMCPVRIRYLPSGSLISDLGMNGEER